MCKARKDLCVYGTRTACKICNERKVRCSFLAKRKRKEEVDSEEDEEPAPKKPRNTPLKPSAVKPVVEISGPSSATVGSPIVDMVGLLRELVGEVREVKRVIRGVSGLTIELLQQNAKLVRLGEYQSFLAEEKLKKGSGSGSGEKSESEGAKRDKGKGKEVVDETMKSDGGSGVDSGEESESEGSSESGRGSGKDAREESDVGSSGTESEKEK
jgi:hypothetical protein